MTENFQIPSRDQLLTRLKSEEFDILVIGGGATGAGIAFDAATRGLRVALVESNDFSSGSSSRSTKLVHGGVRYLEQAVLHFDYAQYQLVTEALEERALFLKAAPHLTRRLPILTPLYRWMDIPYYMAGLKLYDWLAGAARLDRSYFLSPEKTINRFPLLNKKGLKGAIVYYDGQFNDSRMNVTLALSAIQQGAAAINHCTVKQLTKRGGIITGATVEDQLTKDQWDIKATVTINATGPFTDKIRLLDDPQNRPLVSASAGTHFLLDATFCPPTTGLLIPKTKDGRVLFLLPWEGATLVGTTDTPSELTDKPGPSEDEILYLIDHLQETLDQPIDRSQILAAWTGLRPLISTTNTSSAKLSRDHLIEISSSGLMTIAGGKWTTYRHMAEEAVDRAIEETPLPKKGPSKTKTALLYGTQHYSPSLSKKLVKDYSIDSMTADHLLHHYGDQATVVAQIATEGFSAPIASGHPYLEAEVIYAVRSELACTAEDILARRTRLFFLDQDATIKAIPRVVKILGDQLEWSAEKRQQEVNETVASFQKQGTSECLTH